MRPKNKQNLHEEFVGSQAFGVAPKTILTANLAELARPVGDDGGEASVGQRGIRRAVATIEAAPHSPSAVDAVVQRTV